MEELITLDKKLLLWLNGFHTPWLDNPMWVCSQLLTWLPLYVFLLYLIIKQYKKESWMILVGIALTILVSDQITSSVMKPFFARLRPSHEPSLNGLVHLVNGYTGGKYGFASSHAANTWGIAMLLYLIFRHTKKWIIVLFAWATFVTYTRIYLGVHYPGDVIVGGIIGMLMGWIVYKVWHKLTLDKA